MKKTGEVVNGTKNSNLDKELLFSFILEKDNDYFLSVQAKIKTLMSFVKNAGANKQLVKEANSFGESLLDILRHYYKGDIALAQIKMSNLINKLCDRDPRAEVTVGHYMHYKSNHTRRAPFFRARVDANEDGFKAYEMGVIPFGLRAKTSSERFSMPGLPCLYLGNTSYDCWLEMGKPADYRFNVSVISIDNNLHVLDLTVRYSDIFVIDNEKITRIHDEISTGVIERFMLQLCASMRIREQNRSFKSEYIIPQLVMLACQKKGLDGVAYVSSKIPNPLESDDTKYNLALYSKYPNNRFDAKAEQSDLDNHVLVGDASNYAVFNQIKQIDFDEYTPETYSLQAIKSKMVYDKQFEYTNTKFYTFDLFLIQQFDRKYFSEKNF